jgi:hypothetical protein
MNSSWHEHAPAHSLRPQLLMQHTTHHAMQGVWDGRPTQRIAVGSVLGEHLRDGGCFPHTRVLAQGRLHAHSVRPTQGRDHRMLVGFKFAHPHNSLKY